MADYVSFVYTKRDCEILAKFYSDSFAIRLSLESARDLTSLLPSGPRLWLDAAIDGLDGWPDLTPQYMAYVRRFEGFNSVGDRQFQLKPQKDIVDRFVQALLDECVKYAPAWISVPQLPLVNDTSRNKINRLLAKSARTWASLRNFRGKMVLPVILTHQKQTNLKTERNKRTKLAITCCQLASADGVWVTDTSLYDQDGAKTLEQKRFPALINFQQELNQGLAKELFSVGGPYWGLNLILWARKLIGNPAIGMGNAYQYHLPGGVIKGGKSRVALPPLRRWAVANAQLEDWLKRSLRELPKGDQAYSELAEILRDFRRILVNPRIQVAKFYGEWFDKLAAIPRDGRALALYQDLSSAYVIGKSLPDLPKGEGSSRKAYKVARQFMVNCL